MQITIHRGIDQIGGCITEIATDKARILIDLGRNLPNNNGVSDDPNANEQTIASLTKGVDAIFYTHYHGDHIGLMEYVPDGIDQYIGQTAKEVMTAKALHLNKNEVAIQESNLQRISNLKIYKVLRAVKKGDIVVTPFLVSHSACYSYMFLIEADGKKILHTGDFRDHGYIGKGLSQFVPKYIGQVDFLITEGTMLSRQGESAPTEYNLQQKAAALMSLYKYVFVLCSSTDMDRIATFHKANPNGKMFVCDQYQSDVLDVFTKHNGPYSDLYKFENLNKFPDMTLKDNMIENGFCILIRRNGFNGSYSKFTDLMIKSVPSSESLFIYSMWGGYLHNTRHKKEEYVEFKAKFENSVSLHTSGHATQQCLVDLCNMVNPRSAIIPIHSEKSDNFRHLPLSDELKAKITTQSISIDDVSIEI